MSLSPAARRAALTEMTTGAPLDVLVVGGGVVGSGAALDAATRGARTGLIEARDFASGTSSRSSKLIHGGLRYLEMLDFALVHEALQERRLLLSVIAPHLVRPVPFMYPLSKPAWERFYVGSGIALYDGLAFGIKRTGGLPRHKHLRKATALKMMPSLRSDALTGAIRYYDAQVDDARFTMELARTAARAGAFVASRVAVTGLLQDETGRVVGVRAHDDEANTDIEIRAKVVVGAVGVWTDELQRMTGAPPAIRVRASKGVHLVVPREKIQSETGVILRTEKSVLFIIPWDRHWIIGTTDTDWDLDKAHPAATATDIDYLLNTVNRVLVQPLSRSDIDGVYAGLRPLVSTVDLTPTEATETTEPTEPTASTEPVKESAAATTEATEPSEPSEPSVAAVDVLDTALVSNGDPDDPAAHLPGAQAAAQPDSAHIAKPATEEELVEREDLLAERTEGKPVATTKVSREHVVGSPVPGLVVIAGGKYTTYRVMAKDVIDEALKDLGGDFAECTTDSVPLLGALGYDRISKHPEASAAAAGLSVDTLNRLLHRYGSLTSELVTLITLDPSLGEPLPGAEGHLKVEVVYAAAQEGALHLTDVLTRRTRVSIEESDRGVAAAPHAAALLAPILGWDEAKIAHEIDVYLRRVEAEMSSQTMPDDSSAQAERRKAPDQDL